VAPPEPSESAPTPTRVDAGADPSGEGGAGGGQGDPEPGDSRTSAGCGTPTSLSSGNATIDVSGTQREYILSLPSDYDPDQPYKLVFGLHWRGGQASDVATSGTIGLGNFYGLEELAQGSAIFVAPNGIDNGWANSNGRDIALMRAILERFESDLCIDLDRVFSVGFSYGGMMSFAIACEMGDVFRAIAPISGALYSGCGNGTEPIAMWGAHGMSDDVVPINDGRTGLQAVLDRNNCGGQTTAVSPDPCVSYEGCDEGYPVTWCEFNGGHSPSGWMTEPIWDFFSQF
jgi:poly(3-hydroxybutyrate) depolymerase